MTSEKPPITTWKVGIQKIGAELLKRYGEGPEVVHAALGHHDEILVEYPYTVVVATADACSASRPGARRESLDRYIKRMEELELIAKEFKASVKRLRCKRVAKFALLRRRKTLMTRKPPESAVKSPKPTKNGCLTREKSKSS